MQQNIPLMGGILEMAPIHKEIYLYSLIYEFSYEAIYIFPYITICYMNFLFFN